MKVVMALMFLLVPVSSWASTISIAYSLFAKYNVYDEFGYPATHRSIATAAVAHVKGKELFLYSYAEEDQLDWNRVISNQWVKSVVEANPSDFLSSAKESPPSAVNRIDWGRAARAGIIGGLIGE